MILSDRTITQYIESANSRLDINPFDYRQIQSASVDLRLGSHFLSVDRFSHGISSLDSPVEYVEYNRDTIIINSLSFLLATTKEYIVMPDDLTAFVEGRSSIGRMGLFVQNAGWIDSGFEGEITLELFNASSIPIQLISGWRICQLVFAEVDQIPEDVYAGKYQKQKNAVGSRLYEDSF